MSVERILFVNQEITPYLEASYMSIIGRYLPQSIQEQGIEIRTFMPRYGMINERRNQLHEVIRLSGQNIVINDNDHALVVKVASIQSIRMQTYFIDSEEYFLRKEILVDKSGRAFSDNDERAIFYAKGVVETVKNLGWSPDIIHCHGWISCLIPLFVKTVYMDNPLFANSKIVYSVYNDAFDKNLNRSMVSKLKACGVPAKDAANYKMANYDVTTRLAMQYADATVISHEDVDESYRKYALELNTPTFEHKQEQYADDYLALYNQIIQK